jgi:Immunity protein 53
MAANAIQQIESWFEDQCNDDWEHSFGVHIETLDNPGWHVKIDLTDTHLKNSLFKSLKREGSNKDWIDCRVEASIFEGYGGSRNLEELLLTFLDWAHSIPKQ